MALLKTLLDAADALLKTILTPDRYGNPDDQLGSVLFWPTDPLRVLEHPMVGLWLRLATPLTATELTGSSRVVQMGSSLEQQPLSHTTS